jgi:Outer membrane efflux protein
VATLSDRGENRRDCCRIALASCVAVGICCALPLQVNAQSVSQLSMAEAIQLALPHNSSQHLRLSKQEVVQQVRQLYCQIVDDGSALKSAQANIDLYAELERVTKIYVTEKTALASDLLGIRARLLHARYERTSASNALATDEEELNDLLGRPVESDLTLDPDITLDFVLPTPAEAMQRALTARPDLQVANLRAKQADLSRREKKAEFIPNLSLEASYAAIHDSSLPIGGNSYAEVGVQLKWEPFDWGRKHHELTDGQRPDAGSCQRRCPQTSSGAHHRWRDGLRSRSFGGPWRPAPGAAVLRAERRAVALCNRNAADRSYDLRICSSRSEIDHVERPGICNLPTGCTLKSLRKLHISNPISWEEGV